MEYEQEEYLRHGDDEIPDLYINEKRVLNDIEALQYDDDPVYTRMANEGKLEPINPYNNMGGLRPYMPEENYDTTFKRFNSKIAAHNINDETKNTFYKKVAKDNLEERDYLNQQNKLDHIRKIDLALGFPSKPSTYTDSYRFTDKKAFLTEHPDNEYHSKRSEMKTYTEFKIKQGHIMRK